MQFPTDGGGGEQKGSARIGNHLVTCAGTCRRVFYCPEDEESYNFCPLCQTSTFVAGPATTKGPEEKPGDGRDDTD